MERIKDLCGGIEYDSLFKDVPLYELGVESDELNNNLKVKLGKGSIIFYHKHLKSFDGYGISNRQIFRIEIDEEGKFSSVSIATGCKNICFYYLSILKSQGVFGELLQSIGFSFGEIKNETDVNNFIENENRTIDDYLETTGALLETLDHEKKLFGNVGIDVFSPDTPIEKFKNKMLTFNIYEGTVVIVHADLGVYGNQFLKWRYVESFDMRKCSMKDIEVEIGKCRGIHGLTWVFVSEGVTTGKINTEGNDSFLSQFNVGFLSKATGIPVGSCLFLNVKKILGGYNPIQIGLVEGKHI